MYGSKTVGVVIPAFNEAPSIALVVTELKALRHDDQPLVDHLVVCDNGSTDNTADAALQAGAILTTETRKGYGAACRAAIAILSPCDLVVFVDGDHSCLAQEMLSLVQAWYAGAELVIGSRTLGHMEPGSLTPQQRCGNHLASFLLTSIWHQPVTDLGPFRAIDRVALDRLGMVDSAFGWTVEMQIKSLILGLNIVEVPVTSIRRIGVSKVSGTVRGTIGATIGILYTIAKFWWLSRQSTAADVSKSKSGSICRPIPSSMISVLNKRVRSGGRDN